jgi:16S rRNA (adenine1518-N6/adenine1519-N6)-dimethyltransferase
MRRLVKTTFNQRRKMMRGSIKPLLAQIDNENGQQRDHSDFLSLPVLTKRPEQLSVQDFIDLTNVLEKHMK